MFRPDTMFGGRVDYAGTTEEGLDWGVCRGCLHVDVACCCAGVGIKRSLRPMEVEVVAGVVAGAAGGVARAGWVASAKPLRCQVRVLGGLAVRQRCAGVDVGRAVADVGVFPAKVIVGAAEARLELGTLVGRIGLLRRFSYVVGGAVVIPQVIPDVAWSFALDARLVRDSGQVMNARAAADNQDPSDRRPLRGIYRRMRCDFLRDVKLHLIARSDAAVTFGYSLLFSDDDIWAEKHAFPIAQACADRRAFVDSQRDQREAAVWVYLSRSCRLLRSQLPTFVVGGSALPPLSAWRMVAVAFAGAEVGCLSAEEHRRWIWLVRCVQGAAPVFCAPRLAGLALLAGNRHELSYLLDSWVEKTGGSFHFSGTANLLCVTRAVAWLHLRPSPPAGQWLNLAPRVNLHELSVAFPTRLFPVAVCVRRRVPVFDIGVLESAGHLDASCNYLDVGGLLDVAPSVGLRRVTRSDACVDGTLYTSDLPFGTWETAYRHGVLEYLPWVLGFGARPSCVLDDAGIYVPVAEEFVVDAE
jgi:hypothetical protein